MDKLDKQIIIELSKNSRYKSSELKKNIKTSKQNIINRTNSLIESDILNPYTITNYYIIGKKNSQIRIKFSKLNFEEIDKIVNYLKSKSSVVWIAESFHAYDLSISVIYTEFNIVENLIDEIRELSLNNIKKINFSFIKENYYISFNFFSENSRKIIEISNNSKKVILRKKEESLLKILSSNSKIKLTTLGENLNLSPNSVKYIIKELEKKKIILGYGCFINYLNLKYKWFQIIIDNSPKKEELKEILTNNSIVHISKTYDNKIIIDFIANKTSQVRNLISKLERTYTIGNYIISEIIKIHKLETPNKNN